MIQDFALPIEPGESVDIKCRKRYANMGEKTATCRYGELKPDPNCKKTGNREHSSVTKQHYNSIQVYGFIVIPYLLKLLFKTWFCVGKHMMGICFSHKSILNSVRIIDLIVNLIIHNTFQ